MISWIVISFQYINNNVSFSIYIFFSRSSWNQKERKRIFLFLCALMLTNRKKAYDIEQEKNGSVSFFSKLLACEIENVIVLFLSSFYSYWEFTHLILRIFFIIRILLTISMNKSDCMFVEINT
jgi:hypothetical protein